MPLQQRLVHVVGTSGEHDAVTRRVVGKPAQGVLGLPRELGADLLLALHRRGKRPVELVARDGGCLVAGKLVHGGKQPLHRGLVAYKSRGTVVGELGRHDGRETAAASGRPDVGGERAGVSGLDRAMVVAREARHEDGIAAALAQTEVAHVRRLGRIARALGRHRLPRLAHAVGLATGPGQHDAEAELDEQRAPEGPVREQRHRVHEADAPRTATPLLLDVAKRRDQALLVGDDVGSMMR